MTVFGDILFSNVQKAKINHANLGIYIKSTIKPCAYHYEQGVGKSISLIKRRKSFTLLIIDKFPQKPSQYAAKHGSDEVKPIKAVAFEPPEDAAFLPTPHPVLELGGGCCGKGGRKSENKAYEKHYYDMLGAVALQQPLELEEVYDILSHCRLISLMNREHTVS